MTVFSCHPALTLTFFCCFIVYQIKARTISISATGSDSSCSPCATFVGALAHASASDALLLNGDVAMTEMANITTPLAIGCSAPSCQVTCSDHRAFRVQDSTNLTLSNLKFVNCSARDFSGGSMGNGGAFNIVNSSVSMTSVTISNSQAISGGAIYSIHSDLSLTNVTLSDGVTSGNGGLLATVASRVAISNSQFLRGSAANGGLASLEQGSLHAVNSLWDTGEAAGGLGGCVHAVSSSLLLAATTLRAGTASLGGGIYIELGVLTVSHTVLQLHRSSGDGGAIKALSSTVGVRHSSFAHLRGGSGTGIHAIHGSLTVHGCNFTHITGIAASGGAITTNIAVPVSATSFTDIHTDNAGGLFYQDGGALVVDSCTIQRVSGPSSGLAHQRQGDPVVFRRSLITDVGGGMVSGEDSVPLLLSHCIVQRVTGDVFVNLVGSSSGLTISNCQFSDLTATESIVNLVGGASYRAAVTNSTFTRTRSSKGILAVRGSWRLSVSNCSFHDAHSSLSGGAVLVSGAADVRIANTSFLRCSAVQQGGGVWAAAPSTLSVQDAMFTDCTAKSGGSIALQGTSLRLARASFLRSTASGDGGALFGELGARVWLNDTTWAQCSSSSGNGGAIALKRSSLVQLHNAVFRDVVAPLGSGGAMLLNGGSQPGTLRNVSIHGCAATQGGAIAVQQGSVVQVQNISVRRASASAKGGCFVVTGSAAVTVVGGNLSSVATGTGGLALVKKAELTLRDTMLLGMRAGSDAGCVSVESGVLRMAHVRVNGSSAKGAGGVLWARQSTIDVRDSQFSGKIVAGSHGGLGRVSRTQLSVTRCVITGTSAAGSGGAVFATASTVTFTHSTVANCTAGADGGALAAQQGSRVNVTGGFFRHHTAKGHGGGAALSFGSSLHLQHSDWRYLSCGQAGGAVNADGGSTVTVTAHSPVTAATAGWGGGCVSATAGSTVRLEAGAVVSDCSALGAGGCVLADSSALTLQTGAEVKRCSAQQQGGCVSVSGSAARVAAQGAALSHCRSSAQGGGMSVDAGAAAVLTGSSVSHSTAVHGGGGLSVTRSSSASLVGGHVSQNHCPASGGGLLVDGASRASVLAQSAVSGNSAAADGGGVWLGGSCTLTVSHSALEDNAAAGAGGALAATSAGCVANVSHSVLHNNSAGSNGGGADARDGAVLLVSASVLSNNSAPQHGGALRLTAARAEVVQGSMVRDNAAGGSGGGVSVWAGGAVSVRRSQVAHNSAAGDGGGVHAGMGSSVNATHAQFVRNRGSNGGAMFAGSATAVALSHSSMERNVAVANGGGLLTQGASSVQMSWCTLAGNSAVNGGGWSATDAVAAGSWGDNGAASPARAAFTVSSTSFHNNSACTGGALVCSAHADLTLSASPFAHNSVRSQAPDVLCPSPHCSVSSPAQPQFAAQCNQRTRRTIHVIPHAAAASGSSGSSAGSSGSGAGGEAQQQCCGALSSPCVSLSAGVRSALSGGTVQLQPGMYKGGSNRGITVRGAQLTLQSATVASSSGGTAAATAVGGAGDTVVDLELSGSLLRVVGGGSVVLRGITVTRGNGSALTCDGGSVGVQHSSITHSRALSGGALSARQCVLSVAHSVLSHCSATAAPAAAAPGGVAAAAGAGAAWVGGGGAVFASHGSTLSVVDSSFTMNRALHGYGGAALLDGSSALTVAAATAAAVSSASASATSFTSNSASLSGGAVAAMDASSLSLGNGTLLWRNDAQQGGALSLLTGSSASGDGVSVHGNTARGHGGGLYLKFGTLQLTRSHLHNNTAGSAFGGGAVFASEATVSGDGLTVSGNSAGDGGGVFSEKSTTTLRQSSLQRNLAVARGGALYSVQSEVRVHGSDVQRNTARHGGAAFAMSSALSLTRCGVTYNSAAEQGGAVRVVYSSRPLSLSHCTLAHNSAARGGALSLSDIGDASLTACQLADNSADAGSNGAVAAAGGAVLASSFGWLSLSGCALRGNSVRGGDGGALSVGGTQSSLLSLLNCTATANSALASGHRDQVFGGAVHATGSMRVLLAGGSLTHNRVTGRGGALFLTPDVSVLLTSDAHSVAALPLLTATSPGVATAAPETATVSAAVGAVPVMQGNVASALGSDMHTQGVCTVPSARGWIKPALSAWCVRCEPGTFSRIPGEPISQCHSCPPGALCAGGDHMVALPGEWRRDAKSTQFVHCVEATACRGLSSLQQCPGDNTTDSIASCIAASEGCEIGYTGTLCHRCQDGYARSGEGGCRRCQSPGMQVVMVLLLITGLCVVMSATARGTIKAGGSPKKVEISMLKILLSHLQQVAIAASFPLAWPPLVQGMFVGADVVSSAGGDVLALDCLLGNQGASASNFLRTTLFVLPLPLLAVPLCALAWVAIRATRKLERSVAWDRFVTSCIVILFFLHPTVTKTAFRMLTCRSLLGEWRLNFDLEVTCYSASHVGWAVLAFVAILLFSLGVPALGFVLLFRNRARLTDRAVKAKYGFLFAGFREDRYYWEMVITLRKVLIVAGSVCSAPLGVETQLYIGMLVPFLFLLLHIHHRPYTSPHVVNLETAGLATVFLTFYFGMYLLDENRGAVAATLVTLAVVGLNLLNMAFFGLSLLNARRDRKLVAPTMAATAVTGTGGAWMATEQAATGDGAVAGAIQDAVEQL